MGVCFFVGCGKVSRVGGRGEGLGEVVRVAGYLYLRVCWGLGLF